MGGMVKKRVAVTIREDLVEWLDQQVKTMRFHNRSHGVEYAVQKLLEADRQKAKE